MTKNTIRKFRVMLTINGEINQHSSGAPRATWRYAVCILVQSATGQLVAGEIVEGGFHTRAAAEQARLQWEQEVVQVCFNCERASHGTLAASNVCSACGEELVTMSRSEFQTGLDEVRRTK